MKMVKKLLSAGLFAAMILSVGMVANAEEVDTEVTADAITIDSVAFSAVEGDDTLVKATVSFTAVDTAEEVTILMATEDAITTTNTDDVMYINQVDRPEAGVLEFVIEKSRILAAKGEGATDINNTTMYVKMGGTDIDTMASTTKVLTLATHTPGDINNDKLVNNVDGAMLLRYLAGWTHLPVNQSAIDVNGDKAVNNVDGAMLLRYLAGWTHLPIK